MIQTPLHFAATILGILLVHLGAISLIFTLKSIANRKTRNRVTDQLTRVLFIIPALLSQPDSSTAKIYRNGIRVERSSSPAQYWFIILAELTLAALLLLVGGTLIWLIAMDPQPTLIRAK